MIRLIILTLLVAGTAAAEPRWRHTIGLDAGATSLVVVDGVVVAGTWTSELVGLDAATGKELWRAKHPEVAGTHLLAVGAGGRSIAAVPERPEVIARDPRTGKEAWRQAMPSGVDGLAACPGSRLVAVSHRGRGADGFATLLLHALDPVDGHTLWQVPTDGALVGSAPGWLFTGTRSSTGMLNARIRAYRCADGREAELTAPKQPFAEWITADKKRVITRHFELGFGNQVVCSTELETGAQACFPATDGAVPDFGLAGGLLMGDTLYFATTHPMAHNLDPSPDGWLFRYDLAHGAHLGRSEPLTSLGLLADAGDQIVTAFGTTGIDDFGYILDLEGKRLATLPLKKAPRQVAADAERAYFGTYDGEILALDLPRPGRKPLAEVEVAAQAVAEPAAIPNLGWRLLRRFAAHPAQARTSGSMGEGFLYDVAFLDADSLVVGGNDDRAAVWSLEGKRLWQSPGLGKDVQRVQACDGGFAAQIYSGDVVPFRGAGNRWKALPRIKPGFGWAFGVTATCDVLSDTFEGAFTLFSGKDGQAIGHFNAPGVFDRRGVRVEGSGVVVSQDGQLEARNLAGDPEAAIVTWPTPTQAHAGALTQARLLADGRLLREYVGPTQAVIEILPAAGGAPQATLKFDVTGQGWSPTVPSMIAVSPDGSTLAFFRRNLDLLIVDVATERRVPVSALAGPQIGLMEAAFSPDGRRLAIAGYPQGHMVTVLEQP